MLDTVYVIVVVPELTPYTMPKTGSIVPIPVLLLLHAPEPPLAVASVKVIVAPVHTKPGPVIEPDAGVALTVTTVVAVTVPHDTVDTV